MKVAMLSLLLAVGAQAASPAELLNSEFRLPTNKRAQSAVRNAITRDMPDANRQALAVLKEKYLSFHSAAKKRQSSGPSPACQAASKDLQKTMQGDSCKAIQSLMDDEDGESNPQDEDMPSSEGASNPFEDITSDNLVELCKVGGCRSKLLPKFVKAFNECSDPEDEDGGSGQESFVAAFELMFDILCLRAGGEFCLPKFSAIAEFEDESGPVSGEDQCERPFGATSSEDLEEKLGAMCHPCTGAMFKLIADMNAGNDNQPAVCKNVAAGALDLLCLNVPGKSELCIKQMDDFNLFCNEAADDVVPAENEGDALECTAEGNLPNGKKVADAVTFFCHEDQCLRRFFFRTKQFERIEKECGDDSDDGNAEAVEAPVDGLPGILSFPLLCAQDEAGNLCTTEIIKNLGGENNDDGTCGKLQEGFEACPVDAGWLTCGEGACKDSIEAVTKDLGCCTIPSLIVLNADKDPAEVRESLRHWGNFTEHCSDAPIPAPCSGVKLRFRMRLRNVRASWYQSLSEEDKEKFHDAVRADVSAKLGKDKSDIYVQTTGSRKRVLTDSNSADPAQELKLVIAVIEENPKVAEVYSKQIQNEGIPLSETAAIVEESSGSRLVADERVSGVADSGVQKDDVDVSEDADHGADDSSSFDPPEKEKDDDYYVPENELNLDPVADPEADGAAGMTIASLAVTASILLH